MIMLLFRVLIVSEIKIEFMLTWLPTLPEEMCNWARSELLRMKTGILSIGL